MNNAELFSIDVDAHLHKAASHTFGSAGHFPVELVRGALRRGASLVDIQLTGHQLQIQDNGSGLDANAIDTLVALMDPAQPESSKEEAVVSIQTHEGMALLAIFAANPEEILVENVSAAGSLQLHFKKNRFTQSPLVTAPFDQGTHLTLVSSQRDIEQEKFLLEAFCRSVQQEVRLNHRSIGGQPFLTGQLVSLRLTPGGSARGGQIGIPQSGRICHIRLVDQAIPWHHFTLPPQKGLIFDAAVETTGEITRDMIDHLCQEAFSLYHWMGQHYMNSDPVLQDRFEELLYTHCRLSGDESLVSQFARFSLFNSRSSLNLNQLREKAAARALYAVPDKKDHRKYNTAHKTVLSLTREQADFLVNHLSVPVVFLNPETKQYNPFPRWWYRLKKKLKYFFLSLRPVPKKILQVHQLTPDERMFLFAFTRFFSGQSHFLSPPLPGVKVFLIHGRGVFPSFYPRGNKKQLFIRRSHPLVRKAVGAVQEDPRNIEIYIPLLLG